MSQRLTHTLIQKMAHFYPMAKRWLHHFHGGIFPQYNKSLSLQQPIKETIFPEKLVLPLKQTNGQKIELLVQIGSYVKKNQCLAQAAKDNKKGVIVPIHAPTSGAIEAIENAPFPHASGLETLSIIIKPDGKDLSIDNVLKVSGQAPSHPQQLKTILLNAGIVGMGGAGFPTFAKIPNNVGQIHTLVINGAECEPFITCDDLLMQTHACDIIQGAVMVANALGAENIICGVESNKPAAIQALQKAASGTNITIKEVETVYPMGSEKQLLQELTGTEIPVNTHAIDNGLLMFNVATYAAIYRAVTLGEPLTRRLVTVAGFGLKSSYNVFALIGTPFETLANAGQPTQVIDYPLVMGGPMMGFQVPNNQVPVIKTTNCILVNPPETLATEMPCIRCGECMEACPMNLLPQQMYWHSQAHEFDKVEQLNVFDCIECGCCSYVCPSHIPLVQYYRHSKSAIKELRTEQKAAELAKQRHEFRLERIEREKQEREARLKAKKEAVKNRAANPAKDSSESSSQPKKPSAAAAARAAAAKRAAQAKKQPPEESQASPSETTPSTIASEAPRKIPAARQKAIEMAQKSAAAKTGSKLEPTKDPRVSAKRAAAIAAAKRRTQAQKSTTETAKVSETINHENKTLPDKDPKEAAKKAAMSAAKRRAQAKINTDSTPPDSIEKQAQPSSETLESKPIDKRQKAIEAAKKRASEHKDRQAKQQENA